MWIKCSTNQSYESMAEKVYVLHVKIETRHTLKNGIDQWVDMDHQPLFLNA